jgi:glycosyltransferase involved in cell wall biosynthesis
MFGSIAEDSITVSTRNIVHVIGTLGAGGVQKLVLGLATSRPLASYRHSVVCIGGPAEGELANEYRVAGIQAESCPIWWPSRLPIPSYRAGRWIRHRLEPAFPWRLAHVLRRLNADLVHTHMSRRLDQQATATLDRLALPWVWTLHALYEPSPYMIPHWHRALERASDPRAQLTADSQPIVDHLREHRFEVPANVEIVHAGADVATFSKPRERDPSWRRTLGIPADAIVFGSAGRLSAEKGHDVLIDAASQLANKNAFVVIAGSGHLHDQLSSRIQRLGLATSIRMVGFQADVAAFLRELDVFVLPSRSEGFPLALIEGLAAGLPCIATSVGGVAHMLGGAGGLIVPPGNSASLAAAMTTMLDADTRARFARSSPSIARQYSFDASAERFATIYNRLLT